MKVVIDPVCTGRHPAREDCPLRHKCARWQEQVKADGTAVLHIAPFYNKWCDWFVLKYNGEGMTKTPGY